ncbi:MAG TPA: sigma-70 family RNA polymerase sigma factor [Gemmatimonadaceae bacterium]|jgi:RNA polymerase sigma-70 factor (ECF subfamily)|nr:sigma-70 family RNA polymerase sigma factor [Gemmatimonadaceae bacterium]
MSDPVARPSIVPPLGPERDARAEAAERALVARIRLGDQAAFEALFRSYYQTLYEFALHYAGSHVDAEEVAQEVLCAVWERREQCIVRSSVRAYLFAAVRHRLLNTLRGARVRDAFAATFGGESDDTAEEFGAPAARSAGEHGVPGMGVPPVSPDVALSQAERATALRQAVARLPARRREILALRWERGLTHAEIATVLGSTVRAVEQAHLRTLKALRGLLSRFKD